MRGLVATWVSAVVGSCVASCARGPRPASVVAPVQQQVRIVERVLLDGAEPSSSESQGCGCESIRGGVVDEAGGVLLYLGSKDKRATINAVPLAGGEARVLFTAKPRHELSHPAYSAGGALAFIETDRERASDIRILPKGASEPRSVTDDGARKNMLAFVGERYLAWLQNNERGFNRISGELMLADLQTGTSRRLGPPASQWNAGSSLLVAPGGAWVASLAGDDLGCVGCRWYGNGYGILRVFDPATTRQRLVVEGDLLDIGASQDAREILLSTSGHVLARDGQRLAVDDRQARSGMGDRCSLDLASGPLTWRAALPSTSGRVQPLANGWIVFEGDDEAHRLRELASDGSERASFDNVTGWTTNMTATALYVFQTRDNKLRIIERREERTPVSPTATSAPATTYGTLPVKRLDAPPPTDPEPRQPLPTCRPLTAAETMAETPGDLATDLRFPEQPRLNWELGRAGVAVGLSLEHEVVFLWQEGPKVQTARVSLPVADAGGAEDARRWQGMPSVARVAGGVVVSWFDGSEIQVARLRDGKVVGARRSGIFARAEIRPHGKAVALVWPVGGDIRARLLDANTLAPVGADVSAATALGMSQSDIEGPQPAMFEVLRGRPQLTLLLHRKTPCPAGADCQQLVELPLADARAFGPIQSREVAHAANRWSRTTEIVSSAEGDVVIEGNRIRHGARSRPVAHLPPEGFYGWKAVASSNRGIAFVDLLRRQGDAKEAGLVLAGADGVPRCSTQFKEDGRRIYDIALRADAQGGEVYTLTTSPDDVVPTLVLRRRNFTWQDASSSPSR